MAEPEENKRKAGQPTKYKPEYCEEIITFFSQEPYEVIDLPHYQTDGKTLKWMDKKREPRKLPTLIGFAKYINVAVRTVYRWTEKNTTSYQEEFLQAFTYAKKLQKDFLIQAGLMGLYNPIFAKFTAINITDMRDQQEHVHTFDWRTLSKGGTKAE